MKKRNPWAWIPTLYFAEGLPNVVVMTLAVVMYMEMGMTDNFPQMHDYFRNHTEILPLEVRGPFSKMVLAAQEAGEHPTAAFPSSHVGMTMVTLILAWKTGCRKYFWILFPFALILFFATVYLKAHYVVDSVAGIFFGCLFYWLADKGYRFFMKTRR